MGKGHKHGHKSNHHKSGLFMTDMKHGFIGGANAIQSGSKVVTNNVPLLQPVGKVIQSTAGIEKLTASGIDSLGAKNPSKRFNKDMKIKL